MKYYVSVTETLNRVVSVEANSEKDAIKKANEAYDSGEIVLDYDDQVDLQIEMKIDQNSHRETVERFHTRYQEI